ncbi:MAG TPA: hypothetical protein VFK70_10890 [Vicinamibacteria bacterium]|nr:hypothetical protein [Vicinamibacteria bacterium]
MASGHHIPRRGVERKRKVSRVVWRIEIVFEPREEAMKITRSLTIGVAGTILISANAWPQSSPAADAPCAATSKNRLGLAHDVGQGRAGNHGNEKRTIATALWPDGTVTFQPGGPGCVDEEGGLWMKWPWWHEGKDRRLVIEGHRLDGEAPPLRARIPEGYAGEFQSSALIFPTPGCWQVTGKVDDETLTFVVRAVKVGEGPPRCKHQP